MNKWLFALIEHFSNNLSLNQVFLVVVEILSHHEVGSKWSKGCLKLKSKKQEPLAAW